MGLWLDFGGKGEDILVRKYIRPQNCTFQTYLVQIWVLTRRVVAFCTGIAICHRRKFGQDWGIPSSPVRSRRKTPLSEGTPLDLRLLQGKIVIILRRNPWAVGWSPEGTFYGFFFFFDTIQ